MAAPSKPTTCHLLRLPAELRLEIYELVLFPQLQEHHPLPSRPKLNDGFVSHHERGFHVTSGCKPPALLAINRQIRNEACKLFYDRALFFRYGYIMFDTTQSKIDSWLASLAPMNRERVKHFTVEYFEVTKERIPAVSKAVKNLNDGLILGSKSRHLLKIAVQDNETPRGWRYAKVEELLSDEK